MRLCHSVGILFCKGGSYAEPVVYFAQRAGINDIARGHLLCAGTVQQTVIEFGTKNIISSETILKIFSQRGRILQVQSSVYGCRCTVAGIAIGGKYWFNILTINYFCAVAQWFRLYRYYGYFRLMYA